MGQDGVGGGGSAPCPALLGKLWDDSGDVSGPGEDKDGGCVCPMIQARARGVVWCGVVRTLICPLRMVVESTFSLVASVGSMKACHDQLAIMSSMTCSIRG